MLIYWEFWKWKNEDSRCTLLLNGIGNVGPEWEVDWFEFQNADLGLKKTVIMIANDTCTVDIH